MQKWLETSLFCMHAIVSCRIKYSRPRPIVKCRIRTIISVADGSRGALFDYQTETFAVRHWSIHCHALHRSEQSQ